MQNITEKRFRHYGFSLPTVTSEVLPLNYKSLHLIGHEHFYRARRYLGFYLQNCVGSIHDFSEPKHGKLSTTISFDIIVLYFSEFHVSTNRSEEKKKRKIKIVQGHCSFSNEISAFFLIFFLGFCSSIFSVDFSFFLMT